MVSGSDIEMITSYFENLAGKWTIPGYDIRKYTSLEAAKSAEDAYGDNIVAMLIKVLAYGNQEAVQEYIRGARRDWHRHLKTILFKL